MNRFWHPCLYVLLLIGCSDGGDSSNTVNPQAGASDSVQVSVELAPELTGKIVIEARELATPGENHLLEVTLVLRNSSSEKIRLALNGLWLGQAGGNIGSIGSSLSLRGGQTQSFTAGANAENISAFRLMVSSKDKERMPSVPPPATKLHPQQVQGWGLSYTPEPTLAQIPAWPAKGAANGQGFTAAVMVIYPFEDQWRIEISDREFDPMKGLALARTAHPDLQTINLILDDEPSTGDMLEKPMSYGGGMFQIKRAPNATKTSSYNAELAYVIEFATWERHAWQADGPTFQRGGSASGKLYVCFKGSTEGGIADSYIAGTFEDVPIVYFGQPH